MCSTSKTSKLAYCIKGTFVHSTDSSPMEILQDHIMGVNSNGKIEFFENARKQVELAKKWRFSESDIRELGSHEFCMPGMVDTHIHASQYSFSGTALDLSLLDWLDKYTFPTERKYKEAEFAKTIYSSIVRRTLRNGTTTACYFATIYTDSSLLLAEIANNYGQRAFVGKVCMDINNCAANYKETTDESIAETERFIKEFLERKYCRVKPIITPRFAVSCSEELLQELGELAKIHGTHIQSHISEAVGEVESVKTLFPNYKHYTDVYDKSKLLTDKTVMAHGCYLSDEELAIFRERGAAISHCPNSNISLCSGHLDVRKVLKHKVKIGLGTDVAGGYCSSMLDAIRRAIDTSKVLYIQYELGQKIDCSFLHTGSSHSNQQTMPTSKTFSIQKEKYTALSYKEAFRLATLGGSQALNIDDVTGNFQIGKEFDAILVSPCVPGGPFDVFADDTFEDVVQKFLNLGDDRNIKGVYVAGQQVVPLPNA
ncbi:guanine deaminase isoform X2 [Microcaecilia unicolor]|uniref:Guanine deaminase n=1 Tax=Microcaecilia unicolor TaxID=1415580 RepID=A0A6P7XGD8_9AMPH|nr:guanine deaminase isoform X2 [Microcaecilia unicolor]